jgi:hypothetical protein
MRSLSTREKHLLIVEAKRKVAMKGEKYHSHRRSSPKFRKIIQNNNLLIKELRKEFL